MKLNSLSLILSFSLAALVHCDIPSTFVLIAHAPGTPLNGKPVNANELAFWIGKPTASYCPSDVLPPGTCPPGNQTVVTIIPNMSAPCSERAICGSAALSVEVPGGQQIYVDSSLALRFTVPHSGFIPAGSFVSNFSLSDTGRFGWNAREASKATFLACPTFNGKRAGCEEVTYQIYGLKDKKIYNRLNRIRCVHNVTLKATPVQGLGAWEYI